MKLTHVGKYLPEGTRALSNLLTMLAWAAFASKVSSTPSATRHRNGLSLDEGKYWIGINYEDPENLWFATRCQVNLEAARRLGVGKLTEESWVPGRYRWWRGAELNSEAVHFFCRSKVRQLEWLEDFLRECLAQARSIETPDQPPIPEEPEGA